MDIQDEYKQMIIDCQNRKARMSEWEQKFINNLYNLMDIQTFSKKQIEILNKIWDRIT